MKIVAATPHYPGTTHPFSRVGSWLATHEFLAALAARGHHVAVYPRCTASRPYQLDGVHVEHGKSEQRLADAIQAADIAISHLGDDGICSQLAQKYRVPNVRMVHSPAADAHTKLAGTDLAVFNSQSLADETEWDGPHIIANPPRRPIRSERGEKVTLVNLSEAKGGDLFWRLARQLTHIEFLGVHGYNKQVPGGYPNVHVIANQVNMERVYSRTHILLMPSREESWGMVGVEALSCGIPVIAHPTPGLRESLGDAGIFVDRKDARGWVDQIERLQDFGQWEHQAHLARLRARELPDHRPRFCDAIETLARVPA